MEGSLEYGRGLNEPALSRLEDQNIEALQPFFCLFFGWVGR